LRRDERQLAHLVAAEPERNRVIALCHESRLEPDGVAKTFQLIEWRWKVPELNSGKRFEAVPRGLKVSDVSHACEDSPKTKDQSPV
jgi:hypothetical protein